MSADSRRRRANEDSVPVTALQVGNPDLRSGVDLIVRPAGGAPMRVLSVHLKAGCTAGDRNEACPVLLQQVPVLEHWIDQRAGEGLRFAVLGDYNRRGSDGDIAAMLKPDVACDLALRLATAAGRDAGATLRDRLTAWLPARKAARKRMGIQVRPNQK